MLGPSLQGVHRVAILSDAEPRPHVIRRCRSGALADFQQWHGDCHLAAAIGMARIMRHGPERGRKVFRGVGSVILGREGHRNQWGASARAILRRIEAFTAERVCDQRLGFVILPSHAAGVQAVADLSRRSLTNESRASLAEQFLIAVADGAGVERLVQRRVRMFYAVPVAATLVSA